jgi:WD40 repeat protein/serine/threonine protein kinase/tetratricopeptide (TPR) repeat protein
VQYRNGVFGHGASRFDAFYEKEMGPLLFPAANEILAEGVLDLLGPRGSRLVQLTELRTLEDGRVEVGLRELVGLQGERLAPLTLTAEQAAGLLPNRVALLWPGHAVPLRLDPLLVYREGELAEEVLFLNRDRNGRQVEYLSYTTGRTERDRDTVPELAALLSRITDRPVSEEQVRELAERTRTETASVEELFDLPPSSCQMGDFEILGEVGRGAMGVVYLARQMSLGRLVALKTLPADLAGDTTALARFRREVRALARCDHPNIVKVLSSGTMPDGQLYYTMEYVPGCDLERLWRELAGEAASVSRLDSSTWRRAVLSASRKQRDETVQRSRDRTKASAEGETEQKALPLPPLPELPEPAGDPGGFVRHMVRLMHDAALALQAVHEQGLVHRDVKPGNLMLTPDGERIVLMDFGLAKSETQSADLSKGAGFLGTLRYAAPEQLAAATLKVGPAADVRALGVILWELLTRRRLFADAADEVQLATRVHDEDVPLLRRIDRTLDRDLEAIVTRATERSASARLRSAGLLAQYLQMYLDGQPLPIRAPGPGELLGRWVRRHRAALLGIGAPLLVLLTVGVSTWIVRDAQARIDEEARNAATMKELHDTAVREREAKEEQRKRAESNEQEANKQRDRAEALQYAADISLAQQAFQENRLFRMRELLLRHQNDKHLKGFEWDYLWRLCQTKLILGPRHQQSVRAIAFSPDGRRAVSASDGGAVKIWDTATGKELVTPVVHRETVHAVAFSPDGKAVASASIDGTVKVWDSANGQELYVVPDAAGSLNGVAFSPDGRHLALAGENNTVILCDAVTGKRLGRWAGHAGVVWGVAFSPDSKLLASTSADKTVKLWDVAAGKPVRTLEGHTNPVVALAFSPDGKQLASSDNGNTIILWDAATGKEVRKHTDHTLPVTGVSFSPDGRHLLSASGDGTARIREVGTDKPATVLYGAGGVLFGGTFSPDGTRVCLSGGDGSVQVWDLTVSDEALWVGWVAKECGLFLAQSPDGRLLAQGGNNGEVWLWDPLTRQKVRTFKGHADGVHGVAFSPDGGWLVSGGQDGVAKVWEVEDGRELLEFRGHAQKILPVAYDPLGRFVATGDADGIIKVWDPRTGRELASLERHRKVSVAGVTSLAFSPDGQRLVSGGGDKLLLVWDTATWQVVRAWPAHRQGINNVAYAPDSHRIAVALTDGTVVIRDERREEVLSTLDGHNGRVMGLAFSSDGRRLVSGGFDHAVRFWDPEIGQPLMTLSAGEITALVFTPDGQRLVAGSTVGIMIWFATGVPQEGGPIPSRWLEWYRSQARDCDKAKQWFALTFYASRLLQADPAREVVCLTLRAKAAYNQDDWRQVVADLTRVLNLTEPTAPILNIRGQAYFGQHQYDRAEADQTRALKLDPNYRDAWLHRGETRSRLGRWADAIADYTEALKLNDQGAAAWRLRGVARAELGQWDQAVADFLQAVERAPTNRRDLGNLAVAHLGRGDLPAYRRACVSMYERLSHTDQPENWNSLSWVCSLAANDAADPARLVRLMDRAVAAQSKGYAFLNTRGAALYRAGRYEDAVRQLTDAVALHGKGGSFEDWVFLAMARFRLGTPDQAREDLARASKLYDEGMKRTKPESKPPNWTVRVEWQQLRKEAEELIEGRKR